MNLSFILHLMFQPTSLDKNMPCLSTAKQMSETHAIVVYAELIDAVDIRQLESCTEHSTCSSHSFASMVHNMRHITGT